MLKGSAPPSGTWLPGQTTEVLLCLHWRECVHKVCFHHNMCVLHVFVDFTNFITSFDVCGCMVRCVQFVGWEPHTVGPRQGSVALIWARLHMDLIGWEIITYWWKMREWEMKETGEQGEEKAGIQQNDAVPFSYSLQPLLKKLKHFKCSRPEPFPLFCPVYFALPSFMSQSLNHINIHYFMLPVISQETQK